MITLENDFLSLGLSPELGASVLFLRYKGQDILRPALNATSAKESSLYVMLPYCGHISDGKFTYFGITRQIIPATSRNTASTDGDGWQNNWKIDSVTKNQATLLYKHDKKSGGFQFDYHAKVTYSLEGSLLHITVSVKNPSKLPLPCGMGIAPCFMNKALAKLYFTTTHVWHHENTPIFDRPYETPKEWNFHDGKSITENFDTSFGGWDGQAMVKYPNGLKIHIQAPGIFHHITLDTHTTSSDSFILAPVSNTPDAFNLAALGVINTGIQSIGPEQTLTQTITLSIESQN